MSVKGNRYTGTVQVLENASCLAFSFSAEDDKDLNKGKGYIVPVYNDKNMPVKDYYLSAADIKNGYGQYLLGLSPEPAEALQLMEEGIKQYPDLKLNSRFLIPYLGTLGKVKKAAAAPAIATALAAFEGQQKLTENDYVMLSQWYGSNKEKAKADSFFTLMKTAFPAGEWQKALAAKAVISAAGADKKAAAYKEFVAKYPPTEKDKLQYRALESQIANAYSAEQNFTAYNEWNSKLDKATIALNNNNLAWSMAEQDKDIESAKKMAHDATMYAEAEMKSPSGKIPEGMTSKQWEAERKNSYAMYGDTYAFILYKLGDYKTAFPISKDAATINKFNDAEYNERYAMLAEKVLPATEATP